MAATAIRGRLAVLAIALVVAFSLAAAPSAWADDPATSTGTTPTGATTGTTTPNTAGTIADTTQPVVKRVAVSPGTKYGTTKTKVKNNRGKILLNKNYLIASAAYSKNLNKLVGANGKKAVLKKQTNNKKFKWKFLYVPDRHGYQIKNLSNNKVLTVKSVYDGARVYMAGESHNMAGQLWIPKATKNGYAFYPKGEYDYAITVKGSKLVLNETDSKNTKQQFWLFEPKGWKANKLIKNGYYTLNPVTAKKMLLSLPKDSYKTGAKASMKKKEGYLGQMFKITSVGGNNYKIESVASSKALTSTTKGAYVRQRPYKVGNKLQQWKAKLSSSGNIIFVNRKTGKALDVVGNKVTTAKRNSKSDTQRWAVSPTTTGLTGSQLKALEKANQLYKETKTKYYVGIDMSTHLFMVFERKNKKSCFNPIRTMATSTGAGSKTPCTNGKTIGKTWYTDWNTESYTAYYYSSIGSGRHVHSVLCYHHTKTVKDSRLGYSISGGCIRLSFENAIWFQDNIASTRGTVCSTYY